MPSKLTGLWRHNDFLRLWSGQTISVFGSMIGGTALDFTAILVLGAMVYGASTINPGIPYFPNLVLPIVVGVIGIGIINVALGLSLIASVRRDTPASRAGVQVEDVVSRVDGKPVVDDVQFPSMIAAAAPWCAASSNL